MELDVDDMVAVPLTQQTRETGERYVTMANNLGALMDRIIEQAYEGVLFEFGLFHGRRVYRRRWSGGLMTLTERIKALQGTHWAITDAEDGNGPTTIRWGDSARHSSVDRLPSRSEAASTRI